MKKFLLCLVLCSFPVILNAQGGGQFGGVSGGAGVTLGSLNSTTGCTFDGAGNITCKTFDISQTTATTSLWANTTAATVGTSQSSPIFQLQGTAWHAGASVTHTISIQDIPGNGTDAASTLQFSYTGSSTGVVTSSFPGPVQSGSSGGLAGALVLPQGTAQALVSTNIILQAPAAVTNYEITLPGTAATGIPHYTNAANVITESIGNIVPATDCPTCAVATSCATANAIGIFTASTTVGCGAADFTYGTTAHTLADGAAGIVDFHAGNGFYVQAGNCTGAVIAGETGLQANNSDVGELCINPNAGTRQFIAIAGNNAVSTTCTNQVVIAVSSTTQPTCAADPAAGINNFNQAAQSQVTASGTEYYLTHSDLDMPATYHTAIAAGTTMNWRIALTKTAAGTGTFQILLKKGTNGSTADTSIVTQTIGTQTAAVDNMEADISLTWTSATAAYWTIIPHQAAASATGFGLVYPATAAQFTGTIAGQTTTTASDKYGLSVIFTTGTPTFVVNFIKAEAFGVN